MGEVLVPKSQVVGDVEQDLQLFVHHDDELEAVASVLLLHRLLRKDLFLNPVRVVVNVVSFQLDLFHDLFLLDLVILYCLIQVYLLLIELPYLE